MRLSPRILLPLLALLAVPLLLSATRSLSAQAPAASDVAGAHYRLDAASAKRSGAPLLSGAARRATFRFDPAVAPADRQAFLAAVASGRPEARRLIALVDGLVDVRIGPTGMAGAIGLTEGGEPGYRVTIDLDLVIHRYGPRGVAAHRAARARPRDRPRALTDDVLAALDAGIPAGWGCEDGKLGACADRQERFAETFAKWALGRHRRQPRHRLQGPAAGRPARRLGRAARSPRGGLTTARRHVRHIRSEMR